MQLIFLLSDTYHIEDAFRAGRRREHFLFGLRRQGMKATRRHTHQHPDVAAGEKYAEVDVDDVVYVHNFSTRRLKSAFLAVSGCGMILARGM